MGADRPPRVATEVDAGIAALRDDSRRRLRISASLTVAEQLLPGWLVSLRLAATARGSTPPDVVLTTTNSDTVPEHVQRGTAELGFVEGPRVPRTVRSRVVGHDVLTLVVPPDHPWARRTRPVPAATLAGTPLVAREPGSGTRDALRSALVAALGTDAVTAAPALELSTSAGVRQAVRAGAGPAVLSELAVADDVAAGRLHAVPIDGVDLRRTLRAVWLGARTPPAGAVRDLLGHHRPGTRLDLYPYNVFARTMQAAEGAPLVP